MGRDFQRNQSALLAGLAMRRCRICEKPFDGRAVTLPLFHPEVDAKRDDIWAHEVCLLEPAPDLIAKRDEVCMWAMRESMDGELRE